MTCAMMTRSVSRRSRRRGRGRSCNSAPPLHNVTTTGKCPRRFRACTDTFAPSR
jgi:hypothetical protein